MARIRIHSYWPDTIEAMELFMVLNETGIYVASYDTYTAQAAATTRFIQAIDEAENEKEDDLWVTRIKLIDCRGADRDKPQLMAAWRRFGHQTCPSDFVLSEDGLIICHQDVYLGLKTEKWT